MANYNKTHKAITENGSALHKYQRVIVGSDSLLYTVYFELCSWLSPIPGAVGLLLRKLLWPSLFGDCGKGVQFASGITLRHPKRIKLGSNVVISEGVVLDARNEDSDIALSLDDNSMISNQVIINCKGGNVVVGKDVGLGAQTVIQSTHGCPVTIGNDVIIGPRCYLVGGGSYNTNDLTTPIRVQGIKPDNGCIIDDNVWLGANVTVLGDGHIKSGAVIAASAVVNATIESNTIAAGIPAQPIKTR